MGEDEDLTINTLTGHREMMTTLIEHHKGRVVDSPGDNLLSAFPSVTQAELVSKKEDIETIFTNKADLVLTYKPEDSATKTWNINKYNYKDWIDVASERIFFNDDLVTYVQDKIAADIEINVQEARFELTASGKVSEFSPSSEGYQIPYDKMLRRINQEFFADFHENYPVAITTEVVLPKYTTDSINDLGIKEIIGVGESNFAGSPNNRRHNIKIGAQALHGVLVPPGEELSLAAVLGSIDASSGYLPELVIKGNKTIPEYGGGLCQIGTTLFRGALQSGLEITERRNHSYAVSYYGTPGFDATIYPGYTDLRFLNNTPGYILIQTKTEGTKLIFEFWGTDDGREVALVGPNPYSRQSSGAVKSTLEQRVTRDGEVVIEDTFYSNYKSPKLFPKAIATNGG